MAYALIVKFAFVQEQDSPKTPISPDYASAVKHETTLMDENYPRTQNSGLVIVGKSKGEDPADYRFKMGENLKIRNIFGVQDSRKNVNVDKTNRVQREHVAGLT